MQLSCEELPYDLVPLAKTEELPDGCARDAWESLTSEYDLTEGEDKITLLAMFHQNQLEDVAEKLQFSFELDLRSPEIYNSLDSFLRHS